MPNDSTAGKVGRRDLLKYGAAAAAVAGTGSLPLLGSMNALAQVPGEPLQFAVDIPGAPLASKNIREIAIDDMVIEPAKTNRPLGVIGDVLEKTGVASAVPIVAPDQACGPGEVRWGEATLVFLHDPAVREIEDWWSQCNAGKDIRRNITIVMSDGFGARGRSYTLFDCFPTQWSSVNFDTSSTVQTETMRVKLGRVEFKT
jgi:tail tube protein gp19